MKETLYSNEELEKVLGEKISLYYPSKHIEHGALRVSVIFEKLRDSIRMQDPVAIEVGCRLISEDPRLPFGKLIKSSVARSLRQNSDMVSHSNRKAIVRKTIELLGLPFAPRELEDYCKLIKKFEASEWRPRVDTIKAINNKSQYLISYLQSP